MDSITSLYLQSEQNDMINAFCSVLVPSQTLFFFNALWSFYQQLSLFYWCRDFDELMGFSLVKHWLVALDKSYGEWLDQDSVQHWLGQQLNTYFAAHRTL